MLGASGLLWAEPGMSRKKTLLHLPRLSHGLGTRWTRVPWTWWPELYIERSVFPSLPPVIALDRGNRGTGAQKHVTERSAYDTRRPRKGGGSVTAGPGKAGPWSHARGHSGDHPDQETCTRPPGALPPHLCRLPTGHPRLKATRLQLCPSSTTSGDIAGHRCRPGLQGTDSSPYRAGRGAPHFFPASMASAGTPASDTTVGAQASPVLTHPDPSMAHVPSPSSMRALSTVRAPQNLPEISLSSPIAP